MDPNHPAATALAGIGKRTVDEVKQRAPALDFITVQFYGDIVNLQKRLTDAQWDGPYMVTEWGATGHWEVRTTEWKAPIEETSSQKAKAFAERYEKAIAGRPGSLPGLLCFPLGAEAGTDSDLVRHVHRDGRRDGDRGRDAQDLERNLSGQPDSPGPERHAERSRPRTRMSA